MSVPDSPKKPSSAGAPLALRALRSAVRAVTDAPGEVLVGVREDRVVIQLERASNVLQMSPAHAREFAQGLLAAAARAEKA